MTDAPQGHVALLESYLRDAKEKYPHALVGVAMTVWATPQQAVASVGWAGAADLEEAGVKAAEKLLSCIQKQVEVSKLPPSDVTLDVSYVVWNVANGPSGFDFVTWLIHAEMVRRREHAPAPLKVGFYLGTNPQQALEKKNNKHWIENVYRPAMKLLGAVEDDAAIYGHMLGPFLPGQIVQAYSRGEDLPMFKATLPPPYPNYVTITLREAAYWPHRNSKMDEWLRFARYLQDVGERVILVRDTAKAFEKIDGFETCPSASVNLEYRLALYEGAKCNFCVGGGPWQLCLFGTSPWLAFLQVESELNINSYRPNTPDYWRQLMGVEPGGQFPWSQPNQRIIWAPDEYDHIVAAWKDFV